MNFENMKKKSAFLHERLVFKFPATSSDEILEKVKRWKQNIEADDETFAKYLELQSLSSANFNALVAGGDFHVSYNHVDFNWIEHLVEAFSDKYKNVKIPVDNSDNKRIKSANNNAKQSTGRIPFYSFFAPYLQMTLGRLRTNVEALRKKHAWDQVVLSPELESELMLKVFRRLVNMSLGTFTLELNVARLRGDLVGTTSTERFHYFSEELLNQPDYSCSFYNEYPVLIRAIVTYLYYWQEAFIEFLDRLITDWEDIKKEFFPNASFNSLTKVDMGVSDSHNRGRVVYILQFDNSLKLVYKPKPLGVNKAFQDCLVWLNELGLPYLHKTIRVLDRNEYGWEEFAEAKLCNNRDEISRFYWRQGSYLALLYVLNGSDFHYENLIACGEFPVLIDLETLFHGAEYSQVEQEQKSKAVFKAWSLLSKSVFRVGLLPQLVFSANGKVSLDLSGLGGEAGQVLPTEIPVAQKMYTDEMHFAYKAVESVSSHNKPILVGEMIDTNDFIKEIENGFKFTYYLILNNKASFEQQIHSFSEQRVRHVFRSTQQYATIFKESHHPDYLRDGLEKEKLVDKLWVNAFKFKVLQYLVPSEKLDLLFGDIPYFYTKPSSPHLWDSRKTIIPNIFARTNLSQVLDKLNNLSVEDCQKQVDFIHKAMMLKKEKFVNPQIEFLSKTKLTKNFGSLNDTVLLEAAVKVGEHLLNEAIWGEKDVCWIGLTLEEGTETIRSNLTPINTSLHQGVSGIALFLAHLAKLTQRKDFESAAQAAMHSVLEDLSTPEVFLNQIGAFSGYTSLVYVCHQLGRLWNDDAIISEVSRNLHRLEPLIAVDINLDVIAGSSGAAIVLLNLYRDTKNPQALKLAEMCGQRLLETQTPTADGGAGWVLPFTKHPLSGFSHGVAGIIWPLLELEQFLDDSDYRESVHHALQYERTLFAPKSGNWLDRRELPKGAPSHMTAWCHGAAGVALGRLLCLPYLDNSYVREEIEIAIETTINATKTSHSHCLCHGKLGNAEILLFAGNTLKSKELEDTAYLFARSVAPEIRSGRWLCGMPNNMETPGLMTGIAGIGLSMLHFYSPQTVPSIVRLQHIS